MSQKQQRRARQAQGGLVRHQKQPTAILDAGYIQAPVGIDPVTKQFRYRSPKQVKAYLTKRVGAETVAALTVELEALMPELQADEEATA